MTHFPWLAAARALHLTGLFLERTLGNLHQLEELIARHPESQRHLLATSPNEELEHDVRVLDRDPEVVWADLWRVVHAAPVVAAKPARYRRTWVRELGGDHQIRPPAFSYDDASPALQSAAWRYLAAFAEDLRRRFDEGPALTERS